MQPSPQTVPVSFSQPVTRKSKAQWCMLILSTIQLLLALGIIFFGGIALGLSLKYYHYKYYTGDDAYRYEQSRQVFPSWLDGTPFWGGALLLVSAMIGLCSSLRPRQRCPRIAYLVLVIIAAVISGIICILGAVWAIVRDQNLLHGYGVPVSPKIYSVVKSVVGLDGFVAALGFVSMITCIMSASFWCYQYSSCCKAENTQPGQIIYQSVGGGANWSQGVTGVQTGVAQPYNMAVGQQPVIMTQVPHQATSSDATATAQPGPQESRDSNQFGYRVLNED